MSLNRINLSLFAILLVALLTACAARIVEQPQAAPQSTPNSAQQAALEATAILEQAKATAMIIKAQAEATALVEQAGNARSGSGSAGAAAVATAAPASQAVESAPKKPAVDAATPAPTLSSEYYVNLVGVSYAADGKMIIVQYKASRKAVDDFWPGRLSVTDEATGTVYDSVPTMPVIGPLIGRPHTVDQVGYVMFDNTPPGLPPGSLVTVNLGKFQQEHVRVSQN